MRCYFDSSNTKQRFCKVFRPLRMKGTEPQREYRGWAPGWFFYEWSLARGPSCARSRSRATISGGGVAR